MNESNLVSPALSAFEKIYGPRPVDPKFMKYQEFWDLQYKVFVSGWQAACRYLSPC
jgi:hypothetical protein